MNSLNSLLHEVSSILNLPYTPGLEGGGMRVLVGMWSVLTIKQDSDAAKRVSMFIAESADFVDEPLCSIAHDPIAVLLGHSPLRDYDQWQSAPSPLSINLYNPYFLTLIDRHLSIIIETCIENDVETKLPLDDPTLIHRLWQQIVPLSVICTDPSSAQAALTPEEVRQNALSQQATLQKNLLSRIYNNWNTATIKRKGGGSRSLLRRYQLLGVSDPTPLISQVSRWQGGLSAGSGSNSERNATSSGSTFGKEDIRLVAFEGDISAGHFVDLVYKARTIPDSLGSAAFQLMVAGFVHPGSTRNIITSQIADHVIIENPLQKAAEYQGWDDTKLLPNGAPFKRIVPTRIFNRFMQIAEGVPTRHIVQEATLFLRSVAPYITVEMVVRFLAYQAPIWYGLPRTFAAFGFADEGRTLASGGWVAYARHEPAMAARQAKRYYQSIGLDPESMAEASNSLASCGSGGVARQEIVRAMFSIFLARLNNPIILGGSEADLLRALAKWNGTVALYAIALQSLCFRRPYRFHFPDLSFNASEIEHEKMGPRIIRLSPIAINLSKLMYSQSVALKSQLPKEWLQKWPPVNACAVFVSLPRTGVTPMLSPYSAATAITRSLAHDGELKNFANIYPGFPRHTADYALRIAGLSESEIDLLTDHSSDRARSRISRNTLDGAALPELHARGEEAVAQYLGLAI